MQMSILLSYKGGFRGKQMEEKVTTIPLSRKRKADSVFDDMVAQENVDIEAKMHKTINHTPRKTKRSKEKRKKTKELQNVCCFSMETSFSFYILYSRGALPSV